MLVSTVSPEGRPAARGVLLKGVENQQLVFYTNYHSRKGRHLGSTPYIALTFFWPELERQVTFVTAQELEDRYPDLTPKEREHAFVREHHTTFIIGIGGALRSGKPHDGRSPDYDDWTMNGDILFWNELLDCAFELSSMGIRVDPESLDRQLTIAGCDDRRERTYHKMLLAGQLPPTIGGGIGQSRLSMLLLGKAHIGEVQASIWDDETTAACEQAGILLL